MSEHEDNEFMRAASNAFNARTMLDETSQYLARGRVYERLPEAELAALFIAGMKEWDRVIHPRPAYFPDVEAEYQLRGLQAPHDQVRPEFERLIARATAAAEQMSAERRDAFNEEVVESYLADRARRN